MGAHSTVLAPTTTPASSTSSTTIQRMIEPTQGHCAANKALPDPVCTPGAVLTTDASIVCVSGYSSRARDVSAATKQKVFAAYGISYSEHSNYEVDHLISLELGGSNDISNLWPEAHDIPNGAFVKDSLENHLHSEVCKGNISLAQAQAEISGDWIKYYIAWKGTVPFAPQTPVPPKVTEPVKTPTTQVQSSVSGVSTPANPAVKKSSSGICHPQGGQYYTRTKTYTPFNSIADCVASGGRVSK